jgi:DNA-binding beta-propeller fold protein YncE
VTDISPVDLSTITTIPVGATPVWAVARSDSQRVYVLTQGGGTLVPIDVASNTILPSLTNLSVGAGANFLLYDPNLNRLYVTNPATGTLYIYSTTGGTDLSGTPNDTPLLLNTISMSAGSNPPCPAGCSPVSVAALPNGSRFYVASYASESACSDPNVGTSVPCIVPMVTVFDALSMTPKTPTSTLLSGPSMSLLTTPQFSSTQYAVQPVAACAPPATYAPGTTRFRMFTTASSDSSHVYVSICDAGAIADIQTNTSPIATGSNSPDQLMTDIVAPSGACTGLCSQPATITGLSITSGVATFQATNTFTAGTRVAISGLTSAAGVPLNSQTLTVLAIGLSATQFECNVANQPDVGSTTDTGSAVPLAPPQAPIFLLTGQ